MKISATNFKTHCLGLMERVAQTREEVVITKHGKAVARLVPAQPAPEVDVFGCMAGTVLRQGDLISPIGEPWNADRD